MFEFLIKSINLLQRGIRLKDSLATGLLSGLIGTVTMDLVEYFSFKAGKSENLYGHLAGSVIMRPFRLNQGKNFLLGEIFHLLTGAGFGIPLLLIFKRFGRDYHRLKGAMWGAFTWGLLYNGGSSIGLYKAKPHLTRSHYSNLFTNLIYGVVTAEAIIRIAEDNVWYPEKYQAEGPHTSNEEDYWMSELDEFNEPEAVKH